MPSQLLSTGVTLAFDDFPPKFAGEKTIVLIHGLSGRRSTWDTVVAWLQINYPQLRILAVDLRGHGDSSHVPTSAYNAPAFAADIAALLTHLQTGPALVLGHSLGGLVAQSLAQNHADVIQSLILEDPPTYEGTEARRAASPVASFFPLMIKAMQGLRDNVAPLEAYRALAQSYGPPDQVEERMYALYTWDHQTMQAALDLTIWKGFDPSVHIPVPVLVIRADPSRNTVFPESDVASFTAAQPHAAVVMVEGSEHMVHAEETFDAFIAHVRIVIDHFLNEQEPK